MAASFASRLSGLKKPTQADQESKQFKLTLPPDSSQKSTYEPSATFNNTRSSFRLLKGRIDRGPSTEKTEIQPLNQTNDNRMNTVQKLSLVQSDKNDFKLVLNDDPIVEDKKITSQIPKVPLQKRIQIARQPPKEEVKVEEPPKKEVKVEQKPKEQPTAQKIEKRESQKIIAVAEKPIIREEQAEESIPPESDNDLVQCPEGCGRKFNRKALEKHAKACKLVFMSKRKEFNSEAKRITSKQQALIAKQTKIKEKKEMGGTRGKGGFGKTGDNWKAASEEFRAVIKANKKQEKPKDEGQEQDVDELQQKKVVNKTCPYCQKLFNELFIQKHMESCQQKKEKQRGDVKKKTGKK